MSVVRVGILHSLTGPMAIGEAALIDAARMAIAQINEAGGILGCKIEAVIVDGESNPQTFAHQARRLIEQQRILTLFGCWTSAARKAVKPIVEAFNAQLWYPLQYEGFGGSPCIFYTGSCPNQQIQPAIAWLIQHYGKRLYLIGSDYVFPRTAHRIIRATLQQNAGRIVGEDYLPLNASDFRESIARIRRSQPDAVFNTLNGESNLAFYRQYQESGLSAAEIPIMAVSVSETEIQQMVETAVGHYACWSYFQNLETPANRQFVEGFQKRYGRDRVTSDPIEAAYSQIYLWKQAVESAGSFDIERVRLAAFGQSFEAPGGTVIIESNNHVWKHWRIGRVVPSGQFEILQSSEYPVKPLPWLGVEELNFPGAEIVMAVLSEVSQDIQYSWLLEQKSCELSRAMAQLQQEVAERQRVEMELRVAEEKYRSIFENTVEGLFQLTPDGRGYLSANPALAKILGYNSVTELMATLVDLEQQLYVDGRKRRELLELLQMQGRVINFESRVYCKQGKTIWISENIRAVRNVRGEIVYYEGSLIDITQRKIMYEALRCQQEQADELLLNILPSSIAERLKLGEFNIADSYPEATVLFADIVGFTEMSSRIPATELVALLNRIFSEFDRLAEKHGLEKIKTIGDAYLVVSGVPIPKDNGTEAIAEMALEMNEAIAQFSVAGKPLSLRVGIHIGPVVAGVIGTRKFIYDLWGDTVNIASRMESLGRGGQIQVTTAVCKKLQERYLLQQRGSIYVKGKGAMVSYWLLGRKESQEGSLLTGVIKI
ncbi:MAG: transporter substrate-binding protein [Cyanobacteriota bacterium]|nr:transporter substrate-binding protein [Cyanobacteriota bacterium]